MDSPISPRRSQRIASVSHTKQTLPRSVFFYHLKPKQDKNTAVKAETYRIKSETRNMVIAV
ncbi:hypothetical protein [Rodentibacter abscessus]|uniref:hypothetical protein n=1 Tax=Rodentibacter abscessus TaxID=3381777 RepID=UPI00399C79A6